MLEDERPALHEGVWNSSDALRVALAPLAGRGSGEGVSQRIGLAKSPSPGSQSASDPTSARLRGEVNPNARPPILVASSKTWMPGTRPADEKENWRRLNIAAPFAFTWSGRSLELHCDAGVYRRLGQVLVLTVCRVVADPGIAFVGSRPNLFLP